MPAFYAEDLAYCPHVGVTDPNLPPAVIRVLRENGITRGRVIDLGCNGGTLLAALLAAGYAPVGVEISAASLAIAAETAPGVRLHREAVVDFVFPPCAAVTALGEVLCYAPHGGADTLADDSVLQRIFAALRPGGVLLFDIVICDDANAFRYRRRHTGTDWTLDHAVSEDIRRHRLRRDIVLDRRLGDTWRRSRETHFLVLHEQQTLARRLRAVGFGVETARSIGGVATLPRRTAFICRKPAC